MQPASVSHHPAVSAVPSTATAAPCRDLGSPSLARQLDLLAPATLAQLDGVSLFDRVDTKFLLPAAQLPSILASLADDYLVLEIQERRLHQYRTLYFDTPDFDLYRAHHAGRAVRHKVRSRLYVDTGLSFFEIKSKSQRRTVKHRLATPAFLTDLTSDARAFVADYLSRGLGSLQPTLRNDFFRVTLVGKRCSEQVTLDVGLQFDCEGRTAVLPGVAIAELKQGETNADSPFVRSMRRAGVGATGVSKYCVGVGLLVAGVERDAFDDKLRAIEGLMRPRTAEPMLAAAAPA